MYGSVRAMWAFDASYCNRDLLSHRYIHLPYNTGSKPPARRSTQKTDCAFETRLVR